MSQEISTIIKENYPNLETVSAGQNLVLAMGDKEKTAIKDNAANQALETIRNRIDQFGVPNRRSSVREKTRCGAAAGSQRPEKGDRPDRQDSLARV